MVAFEQNSGDQFKFPFENQFGLKMGTQWDGGRVEDTSQWHYATLFALSIGALALSAMLGPVEWIRMMAVPYFGGGAEVPYRSGRPKAQYPQIIVELGCQQGGPSVNENDPRCLRQLSYVVAYVSSHNCRYCRWCKCTERIISHQSMIYRPVLHKLCVAFTLSSRRVCHARAGRVIERRCQRGDDPVLCR
jgi:hypothetical protein